MIHAQRRKIARTRQRHLPAGQCRRPRVERANTAAASANTGRSPRRLAGQRVFACRQARRAAKVNAARRRNGRGRDSCPQMPRSCLSLPYPPASRSRPAPKTPASCPRFLRDADGTDRHHAVFSRLAALFCLHQDVKDALLALSICEMHHLQMLGEVLVSLAPDPDLLPRRINAALRAVVGRGSLVVIKLRLSHGHHGEHSRGKQASPLSARHPQICDDDNFPVLMPASSRPGNIISNSHRALPALRRIAAAPRGIAPPKAAQTNSKQGKDKRRRTFPWDGSGFFRSSRPFRSSLIWACGCAASCSRKENGPRPSIRPSSFVESRRSRPSSLRPRRRCFSDDPLEDVGFETPPF